MAVFIPYSVKKSTKKKYLQREKGRDLTKSYDKSPYTHRKLQKSKATTQKRHPKISTSQRFRADLGRSVGVTTATKLVWLNRFIVLHVQLFCEVFLQNLKSQNEF